jgi:lysyl-tRNA synthetase class 2
MSPGPRSKPETEDQWRPTASLSALRLRARLLAEVRHFFQERGVLEVETPLLAAAPVTDPHLDTFSCRGQVAGEQQELFLQTSPEYAMKRLLAAGSGPIFQICKAFRCGEQGRHHNPEFTILEWYRPGFDHHDLMAEIDELLAATLGCPAAERLSFAEAFDRYAGIDPHTADTGQLRARALALGHTGLDSDDPDLWLDLLLSQQVQPRLGRGRPTFLHDYPARQAALARVRDGQPPVAERFELYLEGTELANGYHELTDAEEQRQRFAADLARRQALARPAVPVDEHLLAALTAGMPACAGVALGFDRLVLVAAGATHLSEVLAFPIDRA